MENEAWIAVGTMLVILIGMRIAKGGWVKALIATLIAPILLVPMFYAIVLGLTSVAKYITMVFTYDGKPAAWVADFGLAGGIAITVGLFITYCIWERQTIGLEVKGYLGGTTTKENLTSPHALKRKIC
ncbi:MAG: hypothetical protein P1U89_27855 [Verrucomicrobiales bacterium]|nr:hypothetical protein [Verrucomicrobiales bacterium]